MHTLHSTWDLMRLLLPLFHKRQNEYTLYLAPVLWISPVGRCSLWNNALQAFVVGLLQPLFDKALFADQLFSGYMKSWAKDQKRFQLPDTCLPSHPALRTPQTGHQSSTHSLVTCSHLCLPRATNSERWETAQWRTTPLQVCYLPPT